MSRACPVCLTPVTRERDPLGDRILLDGDGTPHTCPQPRTWTVELPAGMRLLSLNDRIHWSVKGRITRDLRKAAFVMARNARIPHLDRAAVVVEYRPPLNGRHRDADNLAAAGKPAIDGALVDARVLDGDDSRHLAAVTYRIGEPYPRGRMVLHITEVLPAAVPASARILPGGER